ncbi:phosphate transporter [Bordetella ansorpii]|uniref:Phosphate transporter n=1 Tax=Bordetella ansorpii TaxID=288768 RepID=A0A157SFE8_9BORD|nr:phosphate transporter [Bordetella ansorpii]
MADTTYEQTAPAGAAPHPLDKRGNDKLFTSVFMLVVVLGLTYVGYALSRDLENASQAVPWILLGLALLIALGFEFVNGFHDTANAVATVIYTRSMPAQVAVLWSGFFNFLGVLTSGGAVAFGIISLLPVELILQVGSGAGMAMVFALLLAAIVWNLGTWYFGLPSSSSHTLVGSIIGVGLANQLDMTPTFGRQFRMSVFRCRGTFIALRRCRSGGTWR